MLRAVMVASLLGLLGASPLSAQETAAPKAPTPGTLDGPLGPLPGTILPPPAQVPAAEEVLLVDVPAWQSAWGLVGLRAIPAGPKTAPNSLLYHPNFSLDLNLNFWICRTHRLYMFADMRLWGQKGEQGVTNARDGFLGTSKREFDLSGGVAWNYSGPWELRAWGYTNNNLNRGDSLVTPAGFTDGFAMENRYYLSPEYAKLGQTGFDVTKATFLSIGYYPNKVMVDNNGHTFKPGLFLRAYLTYDLWDWCYLFGDAQYISDKSFESRLFLFDVGVAVRPIPTWRQWEFRAGAENTGDFQAHAVQNLWYVSLRFIY